MEFSSILIETFKRTAVNEIFNSQKYGQKYALYKKDKNEDLDEDLDTNWLFTYVYLLQEIKDT